MSGIALLCMFEQGKPWGGVQKNVRRKSNYEILSV